MKKPEKANKMINYIEEQLLSGMYPTGSRIPSVRRLSSKFNIAYSTALRGIDYLCRRGILEKSAKRGIYVKNSSEVMQPGDNETIAVLILPHMATMNAGIYYSALHGMQRLAIEKNYILKVIPVPRESTVSSSSLQDLCGDCRGVILLHEYDQELNAPAINLPTVGILMHNNFRGKISTVDIDPVNAAENAINYFSSKKLKRAVIVSNYLNNSKQLNTYTNRGKIFAQNCSEAGIEVKDFMVCEPDEVLNIKYSKKCAYFFTSDSLLQRHSEKYLEEKGVQLAEEHCVIGIDGKSLVNPDFHYFPTIALDWRVAGEYALEECIFRIKKPGALTKRIYLNGVLNNTNE